ncbi:MAG TPA: MMPL family transporter, partial [Bacteroidia bacterium]
MWQKFSTLILRNRFYFLIGLGLITAFFGWRAYHIELSYTYARTLPVKDQANIDYEQFKKLYGEDGSVMVLGFSDKDFYTLKKFNSWYDLGEKIKTITGIKDVLSATTLYDIKRNDSLSKFDFIPVLKRKPATRAELDSIKEKILSLPFYEGLIFNTDSNATLMAITFDKQHLNSKDRITISQDIQKLGDEFAKENNISLHYSGMPYIRTVFMKKVSSEMFLFLLLAIAVTSILLFLFFRSFLAVFFSILVCLVGVVVSVGTLALFGYKIT